MLSEAGQRFGPYEILGELGSGGMGVVYRAWDERLHREVAVKLLFDEYQAPAMRERFLLEARAASALAHPNICTIFDIGEQDGDPYLVMELLEGITLKQKISENACSVEEIVSFAQEIAAALAAAHGKGIVHRDIKPANIFLQRHPGGESQVKVLDFGLAKVSMAQRSGRESRSIEITAAGSTVGTLAYMSPEQARGEALDARSDLFSLGVVMYEMATRRTPFRGATTALLFKALLDGSPDPIRTWNISVPREVERVMTRLLAKDRRQRFQSAAEVQETLRKLETRGDGSWLKRIPRAQVPLVLAADPIARLRPPRARSAANAPDEVPDRVVEEVDEASGPRLSEDPHVLRPRRLPRRENRPRASAFASGSALPEEKADSSPIEAPSPATPAPSLPAPATPVTTVETILASPVPPQEAVQAPAPVVAEVAIDPPSGSPPLLAQESEPGTSVTLPDGVTSGSEMAATGDVTTAATQRSGKAEEPAAPSRAATKPERSSRSQAIVERRASDSDPVHRRAVSAERRAAAAREGSSGGTPVAPPSGLGSAAPAESELAGAKPNPDRLRWLIAGGVMLAALVLLLLYQLRTGSLGELVLAPTDTVLLAPLTNRTGDPVLDDAVDQGLALELAERSRVHWLGQDALQAGARLASAEDHRPADEITAQRVAQQVGARLYVHGELSGEANRFTLRFDVLETASNDRLAHITETAEGKSQLPAAIHRIAAALRSKLGDLGRSGQSQVAPVPLELSATADLRALSAFAKGERERADGDLLKAAADYRQATTMAPGFSLAYLRLAWIYNAEGAELTAAQSASRALATSSRAGERTEAMARLSEELLSRQNTTQATEIARELAEKRPNDAEAYIALARVMRLQGHMTEALLAANQARRRSVFDPAAYREGSLALIGLNRYPEALALAAQAAQNGVRCACGTIAAKYLSGHAIDAPGADATDLLNLEDRAMAFDDGGRFRAGAEVWETAVSMAKAQPELVSAASGMLAVAGLNRALAGRCSEALAFSRRAGLLAYGRLAAFHIALTGTLCDATGQSSAGAETRMLDGAQLHSAAEAFLRPVVELARDVRERRPMQAEVAAAAIGKQRDLLPVALYLRGLGRQLEGRNTLALADLQEVARRRGYAFLSRSIVASVAEWKLSQLYRAQGEQEQASAAAIRFQRLWTDADPGGLRDATAP